mgnify:CR=1 FL=1|jgi:hypothetical protein
MMDENLLSFVKDKEKDLKLEIQDKMQSQY